nr:hypothetical protein [Tanacetum cinerariifolium]
MHSYDNVSRRLKTASTKFAPDVKSLTVGTLAMIKSLKKPCIAGFMKPINSTPPPTSPLHHHSPPPTSSSMIVTPSTPKPTTNKPPTAACHRYCKP